VQSNLEPRISNIEHPQSHIAHSPIAHLFWKLIIIISTRLTDRKYYNKPDCIKPTQNHNTGAAVRLCLNFWFPDENHFF
jgi:hypothetical protein